MLIGLRTAIVGTVLIAASLPLTVFWFWPHNSVLSGEFEEVQERHLLIADNLGAALELYHRDVTTLFATFAPLIARGEGGDAAPLFRSLHFRHICVADPATGEVLGAALAEAAPCPARIPTDRLAMLRELAAGGGIAISGVMATDDGDPRLFIVTETDGRLVVGALSTTFFRNLQERVSFGRLGHATIVDQDGRVLAHPRDAWEQEARDISQVSAVRRMLAGETGVATFHSPSLGTDVVAGFTTVRGPGWGVMVPQPIAELEEVAARINRESFTVLAVSILFSVGLSTLIATQITRRMRRIEAATTRMAEGAAGVQVPPSGARIRIRELGNLRKSFNAMSAQLAAAQDRMIEESYRSGHADMAASALHNIRNAMNPLINRVADARAILADAPGRRLGDALAEISDPQTPEDRRSRLIEYCRLSVEEAERWRAGLAETLQVSTTQFARIKEILIAEEQSSFEPPVITLVELRPLIDEALQLVAIDGLEHVTVDIDASVDGVGAIRASRLLMLQVLQNLLANAVDALRSSGSSLRRIAIAATEEEVEGQPMVRVSVRDSGVGMEAGEIEKIFISGFTRKPDGRGGLGLHWCANTVGRMRGRIFAQSDGPGQGAQLNVLLPRAG